MTNIPCPFYPFLSWFLETLRGCPDIMESGEMLQLPHNFLHRHDVFDESCSEWRDWKNVHVRITGQQTTIISINRSVIIEFLLWLMCNETMKGSELTLIVHTAIFILLALHKSIDLSFSHFLTCRESEEKRLVKSLNRLKDRCSSLKCI